MTGITPQKILNLLIAGIVILLILHLGNYFYVINNGLNESAYWFKKLNFNEEKNLPAIFSSSLLLTASVLLGVISFKKLTIQKNILFWSLLSFIFLFLGLDELLRIHEKIDLDVTAGGATKGIFHYSWVIPYGTALILLGILLVKPLFQLPRKTLSGFILAGFIFVSGALFTEMFTGWYLVNQGLDKKIHISLIPEIFALNTMEELLEMIGSGIFIFFILDFLQKFGHNKDQKNGLDQHPIPEPRKIEHRPF